MLPSAHYCSGVIIFSLMSMLGVIPKSFPYLTLMIMLSVIIDLDFIYSPMHRELLTHTLIFWGCIVGAIITVWPHLWIIAPPIFFHLLLDMVDWGIAIFYPFSRKKYGLKMVQAHLKKNMKPEGGKVYIEAYISNPVMIVFELLIMSVSIILLAGIS